MTFRLSVVVPVFNERQNLAKLTEWVAGAMAELQPEFWELIYVNDGSTDGSDQELRRLVRKHDFLRALYFEGNHGQTAALDAGIRASRGDLVATLDGDLQNDPNDIRYLLARMKEGVGCVCGIRRRRKDHPLRRVSSRIANGVRNWLSSENITDTGCGLKLFRKECLDKINLYEGLHRFFPTLVRLAGYQVIEEPVRHHPRYAGKSKYGVWNRIFKSLRDLLAVRWMKRRCLRYRVEEMRADDPLPPMPSPPQTHSSKTGGRLIALSGNKACSNESSPSTS